MARAGDTVIYTTACADWSQRGDGSFLPLQVQYMERFSAAGMTAGGFIKRDGRQKDNEVLTSRLVDRPLRPMFEKGWSTETQVLQWVISFDGKNSPEPLAITAAGAALAISDIPLLKPVAGVRVGMIAGEFVVNPSMQQMQSSELDLIIAGTEDAVLMIEGFCNFLTEEQMLEAVRVGEAAISSMCKQMAAWAKRVGKPKSTELVLPPEGLDQQVDELALAELREVFKIGKKQERGMATEVIKSRVMKALVKAEAGGPTEQQVSTAFKYAASKALRQNVMSSGIRMDGRGLEDVRPIASRASVLPCTHGSSLFTRGETQALAVTTLGNERSALRIDALQQSISDDDDDDRRRFYLQYFFPPSSVGEVGRFGAPGRREVGHGQLAERALTPAVPPLDVFDYTIRVESTVTESNGSSSMASVCGGCLAMLDAGVPMRDMVAGVAMGLILEPDGKFVVLTDILGSEDALGDMDFKVAGSPTGVTAFQMDIKVEGITLDIMEKALEQAKRGRMVVLGEMAKCSPPPAKQLADNAPRNIKIQIKPEKVGALIGPKGAVINNIQEVSKAVVSVDNAGVVGISASSDAAMVLATELVRAAVMEVEEGVVYRGCRVVKCLAFGAFVEVLPGKDGLVHISELSEERTANVTDVVNEGDVIDVKCIGIESNGKVRLSLKAVKAELKGPPAAPTTGDRKSVV